MIKFTYDHESNKFRKLATPAFFIAVLIIAFIVGKFIMSNFFTIVTVPTGSMQPTLKIDDHLIATKPWLNPPLHTGDIVIFIPNKQQLKYGHFFIKRLIGMPGDHVDIRNGVVYINGKEINEPYVKDLGHFNGSYVVPKGEYFFLGDNRTNSDDSRYWQDPYIPRNRIEYIANFNLDGFKFFKSNYGYVTGGN